MKKLNVYLKEKETTKILVGTLVETDNKHFFFEYSENFLAHKANISPFKLQFSGGLQKNTDTYPRDTFGVFNDSLPDGWGMPLMNKAFRKSNRDIRNITVIDRLAYVGSNGMGALTYEPADKINFTHDNLLDLFKLSENALDVLQGKTEKILPVMAKAGGSPGGARPKILAGFNGEKLISGENELPTEYEHWLIKFRSENDFKDAGKIEYIYAQMAEKAGLNISESHLFHDNRGNSYFGTKRFDRLMNNKRIHTHTLSNLIHADFRLPSLDYEILLKVCSRLTENYEEVKMCFRLMIFNVLSYNRDDHGKNFAFIMDSNGIWSFAPAYDLMFSYGPGGEHSTTVAGEGRSPSIKDFMKLASLADISKKDAEEIIDQVQTSLSMWKNLATDIGISSSNLKLIAKNLIITNPS